MFKKELQKLNFDEKEADIYLALLELGEANIEQIAKKSGVKRTTVYHVIDSLKEKGYIEMAKSGKKILYYALNPKKIGEKLEEKKLIFEKIMPGLLSITNDIEKKPKIRYFEGKEGIREIYKDTLKYHDQEMLVWTTEDILEYFDVDWLWNYYVIKRVENKIWQRAIAPDIQYAKELQEQDVKHLRQIRFCSKEKYPMYVDITLYGGRFVGIMSFKDGLGLIIESEGIYKTLKSIFEMNWLTLK
jgi:HTH-type transcriptional regulator, sugar sensing transcriptional regulator